jgi:spore maturation protein CgeB
MHNLRQRDDLEVTHLAPQGDITEYEPFDIAFWIDYGEDGLPVDHDWKIPKSCGKTVYVCSDAHLGRKYRFEKATQFDYVYFNQKKELEEYQKLYKIYDRRNEVLKWLPHAADEDCYKKSEILKKYDVCFIGHLQDKKNYNGFSRIDALDRLFREFPEFYYGTRNPVFPTVNLFEDAALKFCQSKIVFNISIGEDINMRVFEALSTGSMLLTNWIPTLGELFEDGKHLVTYKTLDEMVKKARYYLGHEDEREKIAETGRQEFLAKHTYKKRIETVLADLQL